MSLWQCDGCGFIGTEEEQRRHFDELFAAEGSIEDDSIPCYGAMEIGGPAWYRFVFEGIHPMTIITGRLEEVIVEHHSWVIPEIMKEKE